MNARRVSIVATLVALCIATNYALVGVPNMKVMDFVVFVGGFCFGAFAGALIGILTWAVYGAINPYGFVPQVWLATMFSEVIYGLVGGFLGRNFVSADFNGQHLKLSIFFGTMGFISTLVYDITTTAVYASAFNVPIIAALVLGAPFTVLHELSNTAMFGVGSIPIIVALKRFVGGEKIGVSKK